MAVFPARLWVHAAGQEKMASHAPGASFAVPAMIAAEPVRHALTVGAPERRTFATDFALMGPCVTGRAGLGRHGLHCGFSSNGHADAFPSCAQALCCDGVTASHVLQFLSQPLHRAPGGISDRNTEGSANLPPRHAHQVTATRKRPRVRAT